MSDIIKRSQDVKIVTDGTWNNGDIYDLRRQLDQRESVKDFIRSEISRLQQLLDTLIQEQISLDMKIQSVPTPYDEPRQKRFLYKPGTEKKYQLSDGKQKPDDGAIDAEVV